MDFFHFDLLIFIGDFDIIIWLLYLVLSLVLSLAFAGLFYLRGLEILIITESCFKVLLTIIDVNILM